MSLPQAAVPLFPRPVLGLLAAMVLMAVAVVGPATLEAQRPLPAVAAGYLAAAVVLITQTSQLLPAVLAVLMLVAGRRLVEQIMHRFQELGELAAVAVVALQRTLVAALRALAARLKSIINGSSHE